MPNFDPTARLMNDTKWREVLQLTLTLGIRYEVAFTWENSYRQGLASKASLQPHIASDPGLSGGGPHKYSEIASIRVPRFFQARNPKTGTLSRDESLSLRYLEGLASLGKLPVNVAEEYIYVYGYTQPDP